jgi:demethylmenaquinone methyltransferase / 2-methoxy-6-polyprenyl-1,4-benzoquinol methylase
MNQAAATPNIDKSTERVREMFAEIAPKYDRMNHLLSFYVDKYWRWRTVRVVAPQPKLHGNAPILDVCTGTGDLALAYARVASKETRIIGTDFCEEMLDIAREKKTAVARSTADDNNQRIEFVRADSQHLPFDSDQFQIVSVAFGLRNVADTMQGLREMTRVCKPAGKVAVLEFSIPRFPPIRYAYLWYFKNVLPRIGQWFARNEMNAYQYLPDTVAEFPAYDELAGMMTNAGLTEVKYHSFQFGIATLYVGTKPSA